MLRGNQRPKIRIKSPQEAFPKCPHCLSSRIVPFGDDVRCRDCNWNSVCIYGEIMADEYIWPADPFHSSESNQEICKMDCDFIVDDRISWNHVS